MRSAQLALAVLGSCAVLSGAVAAVQAQGWVPAGDGLYGVPIRSMVELRYEGVVRQTHDLSCGAAALATLFQHFFGEDVDEAEVITGIRDGLSEQDWAKVQALGFSMLELKQYGERRGYVSEGYKLNPGALEKIDHPFVALTEVRGYRHFVVVRGIHDGVVHVADPAYGNRKLSLERFRGEWPSRRILLFVEADAIAHIQAHGELPDALVARSERFVLNGRIPPARPQDVVSLIDHGTGPLRVGRGVFR